MTDLLTGCARLIRIAQAQHRGKTAIAVLLMLCSAVAAPLIAIALRWLTDAALDGQVTQAVLAGATAAVLALAACTCGHFAHLAYSELSELTVLDLECQLVGISNGSPGLAHHEVPAHADQLTVLRKEIQRAGMALEALLGLVGLVPALVLTAILLAVLNPILLGLLPLALLPLAGEKWAERIVDRANNACAEPTRQALGIFRLTTEASTAKELRVLRLRETLTRRHDLLWTSVTVHMAKAQFAAAGVRAVSQFAFAAGYLGGVLLVAVDAARGHHGIGVVVMSIVLAAQVNQQVGGVVSQAPEVLRMSATLRRLSASLMPATNDGMHSALPPPPRLMHGIDLVGVTFCYPGSSRPALTDVTLTLQAGSTVAIVGENGAGKTSLVKLLCGFYQPTSGCILVDGTNLCVIDTEQWRKRLAACFQDFIRLEVKAAETVGIGDLPRMNIPEAVSLALDRAGASDIITELEAGLETQLGKTCHNGVELSGGQWRKLALGRAYMREQPLLLILDEPTAALDPSAEYELFARYARRAQQTARLSGAITVLVSHRFSTVRMADQIVVIKNGIVAETGDHNALMRANGPYSELFRLQADSYRLGS
jgi:ATP-binding cassette, subfamily B, bacterial